MDGRLCYSNRGIHLLCNVLATSLLQGTSENNLPPEWMELRRFTSNNAEYIDAIDGGSDSSSSVFVTGVLKDGEEGDGPAKERASTGKTSTLVAAIANSVTPDIRESIKGDATAGMNSPV